MKRTATIYSLNAMTSKVNDPSTEKRRRSKEVSPSESVIRNLLSYSKALTVLQTNDTGFIHMVMN